MISKMYPKEIRRDRRKLTKNWLIHKPKNQILNNSEFDYLRIA